MNGRFQREKVKFKFRKFDRAGIARVWGELCRENEQSVSLEMVVI